MPLLDKIKSLKGLCVGKLYESVNRGDRGRCAPVMPNVDQLEGRLLEGCRMCWWKLSCGSARGKGRNVLAFFPFGVRLFDVCPCRGVAAAWQLFHTSSCISRLELAKCRAKGSSILGDVQLCTGVQIFTCSVPLWGVTGKLHLVAFLLTSSAHVAKP